MNLYRYRGLWLTAAEIRELKKWDTLGQPYSHDIGMSSSKPLTNLPMGKDIIHRLSGRTAERTSR